MQSTKLPLYEWVIVLLFCAILILLSFFALFRETPKREKTFQLTKDFIQQKIEITLQGAVANPGLYEFSPKSTVGDVLKIAQLHPIADTSQLHTRRQLIDGQVIRIPEKKWITIYVEGAVLEPGPLQIFSGTRCQELVGQLDFTPDADINNLKKMRRYLKEGEVVRVPKKKNKQKRLCEITRFDNLLVLAI